MRYKLSAGSTILCSYKWVLICINLRNSFSRRAPQYIMPVGVSRVRSRGFHHAGPGHVNSLGNERHMPRTAILCRLEGKREQSTGLIINTRNNTPHSALCIIRRVDCPFVAAPLSLSLTHRVLGVWLHIAKCKPAPPPCCAADRCY